MKIVVCIKEVLDVSFPFALEQETLTPLEEDVFYKVNPADRCAVEAALQLQERHGGEVVLLAFGPQRVEKSLRECLAMGGDSAVRVWDESIPPGSRGKARILAGAAQSLSPDLILCGSRSLDEGSGETPGAMAEFLGLPQVVGVTDLELYPDGTTARVQRKLERGRRQAIECPLPVVLGLEEGIVQPRYAALPQRLIACKAQIKLLTAEEIGVESFELRRLDSLKSVVRRSIPRPRPKKTFNMESGLTAEQRMELMMSGGARKGRNDLLDGQPAETARKLMEIVRVKVLKPS